MEHRLPVAVLGNGDVAYRIPCLRKKQDWSPRGVACPCWRCGMKRMRSLMSLIKNLKRTRDRAIRRKAPKREVRAIDREINRALRADLRLLKQETKILQAMIDE